MPEEDAQEPEQTERALQRLVLCRLKLFGRSRLRRKKQMDTPRAGDEMIMLSAWLGDAAGKSLRSCWYVLFQLLIQLAISMQVGFLYAHPWAPSSFGTRFQLGLIVCFLFIATVWAAHGAANDRLEGWNTSLCYGMEFVATLLLFIAAYVAVPGDAASVEVAINLADWSVDILFYGIFVPMGLTVYDTFVAPLVLMAWKSEGTWYEILIQIVLTCMLLPLEILRTFFGWCETSSLADLAAELEGAACEMATTSAELLVGEDDEEEADEGGVDKEPQEGAEAEEAEAAEPEGSGHADTARGADDQLK